MKVIAIYEAFDGTQHLTADACRAHEARHVEALAFLDRMKAEAIGADDVQEPPSRFCWAGEDVARAA